MSESDPESCRFFVVLLVSFGSQISDLQNFGFFAHPSDERNHGSVWSKVSFSENLGSSWLWINLNGMPWGYYYDVDLDFDPELHCWRSRSFGQIRSHVSKTIQLGFVRRMTSPIRHFFFRWFFEVSLGYLVRQRTDLYSSGYIFLQFDGIQLGSSWFLGLIRTDLWIDWSTIGIQLERWDDYCRSEEGDFWSIRQHPATSPINLQAKESIGTLGVSRSQRDLKSVRFIGVNDLDLWQLWAWLRFIWAFCVAYHMIDGKILVSVGLNLSRSQNLQQAKERRENWEVTPCQWLTESGGIFPDSILESSDEVRDTLSGLYGDSPWESIRCNLKVLLIQYQIRRLLVSGLIQRIDLALTLKGIDSLDPVLIWQLWVLKVTARSESQAAFAVHSSVSYCSLRFSKSFTGFYGKVSLGFRSVSLVKMSQSSMWEKESVEKWYRNCGLRSQALKTLL